MSHPPDDRLPELLGRIAEASDARETESGLRWRQRNARLFAQLPPALVASSRRAGAAAVTSGRWLADVLVDAAPHIPIRDLQTLRDHHAGLDGEDLADALVRNATLAASAVGVGGGALSAIKWTVPVSLATIPLQLAVETAIVAAIEIKLVGELHEVYGVAVRGTLSQRGTAYALSWANRRGVNPLDPATVTAALGIVARQRVQRRLVSRAGRNIGTVAPFMAGALYGAVTNRRQTRLLSDHLRADLRQRRVLVGGLSGRVVAQVLAAQRARRRLVPGRRRATS